MRSEPVPTGIAVLDMAQKGRFADICDLFAPPLRAKVTADALRVGWAAMFGQYGPISSTGVPVSEPAGAGVVAVKIPVTCERQELTVVVSVDDAGRLVNLQVVPAVEPWEPPDYADPEKFDEHDVTVGSGPLAVPGTLSLPRRSGPRPAVVLLGGGGPFDRDMTMGRNKPGKDLAWGLASRGVTVLRFDKVTHAHRSEIAELRDFTMADEYLPHAIAAVHLLRQHPAVDPAMVFVLGHSMGATVAPRVAAAESSVAGLVLLAGEAQPMHWAAVRVVRYLASHPETAALAEPAIEALTRQARMVDSPDLSSSTPTSELPLGIAAPYWLDLRDYDPVASAAALDKPMLILQGGRDYQVTVADDLARWEAGLAGHQDVAIRVYDPDNHLFFPGTGPSTPAEYAPAQHVDPAVVTDIADWLMRVSTESAHTTVASR
ncbi:alpha/beta hydrolase family protein [Streptomyces sp. NPDC058239]|uniref:alpha/beta hydrolase family protein n=1 Tax=unclassified Streptomyces TaxID=2593676 RepID=UPI003662E52F